MPKGFTTPLTPEGRSGVVPAPPPWHNAGTVLAVEYWCDPAALEGYLPPGFALGPDPGHAYAHFCEWQSVSDGGDELLDPIRAQYNEFFLLVSCTHAGQPTFLCPYMYVDNDQNLVRGLIQGLPKQQASIHMTRAYPVPNPAGATLAAGSRFGATMSYRGRRLVEASLTLTGPGEPLGLPVNPCLGTRHFPDLAEGRLGMPLLHDVVAFAGTGKHTAECWAGTPTLTMHPAPNQELSDLAPVRLGRACRFAMGMTITHIRKVADIAGG